MDSAKEKAVHPSFVEIIKQMNTLDAKVFEKLSQNFNYQKIINPSIAIKNSNQFIGSAVPDWFIGWTIDGYDEFDVSASLVRISKFGLIELMLDRTAGTDGYDEIKNAQYLITKLNIFRIANPNMELEIKGTDSIVYVNEYGKQFKTACQ